MEIMIFGAKSIALGVCKAIQILYPQYSVTGFLVSSLKDNPFMLAGLPVREINSFSEELTQEQKKKLYIVIGTPEKIHLEIVKTIKSYGFDNYICMDSAREAKLMEAYFSGQGYFPSLHNLKNGDTVPLTKIYMICFHKDQPLKNIRSLPQWVKLIQVGADLTKEQIEEITDNTGENISRKNANYCEITAFYWLWKNELQNDRNMIEYYGFYHYRRMLDISEDDLKRLKSNNVDVVLQFPTLHEPDIREHHARYIKESDWEAMLSALYEIWPEYARAYDDIFSGEYFYNYNLIIAKKKVLADYCAWLFPILEKTEELSNPKGWERSDRYIAYMSESLMTLYFMYNKNILNIRHTGRIMLV